MQLVATLPQPVRYADTRNRPIFLLRKIWPDVPSPVREFSDLVTPAMSRVTQMEVHAKAIEFLPKGSSSALSIVRPFPPPQS